jgi:DNA-binding NarL/FixJ family response regulator
MTSDTNLTVVVVAAHPAARAGLRSLVESSGVASGVVSLAPGALGSAESAPDTVLADVEDMSLTVLVEEAFAETPVVYLVDEQPDSMDRTERARGYLSRDADAGEIGAALAAVANGLSVYDRRFLPRSRPGRAVTDEAQALTARELQVLRLLATGIPNKQIARELGISEHTAKYHVSEILGKLGAASRTEAVLTAVRQGLLPL